MRSVLRQTQGVERILRKLDPEPLVRDAGLQYQVLKALRARIGAFREIARLDPQMQVEPLLVERDGRRDGVLETGRAEHRLFKVVIRPFNALQTPGAKTSARLARQRPAFKVNG